MYPPRSSGRGENGNRRDPVSPRPKPLLLAPRPDRARLAGRRWRYRVRMAAPLSAVLVLCVGVTGLLSSCTRDAAIVLTPPRASVSPPGSPALDPRLIRVALSSKPVEEAEVWTTQGYRLLLDGSVVTASAAPLPANRITRNGSTWRIGNLTRTGRTLVLESVGRSYIHYGGTAYRGLFRFEPQGDSAFLVVNHVDLESYLAGVLSKELYPRWSPETYRAQAVAARTFAMYHKLRVNGRGAYDVGSTTAYQVYGGFTGETDRAWSAVHSTQGMVLVHGSDGDERILYAQYSACNGGYVNGAYVIRDAPSDGPYAGGQADNDGRTCPRFVWETVRVSKNDLYHAVCASYPQATSLGGVETVRVASQTPYGRAVWLDIVGRQGKPLRIRAEDLRLALLRVSDQVPAAKGLNSMNCTIVDRGLEIEFRDGRGFGHGVGLSQWGAEDKARRGWTGEQILAFYYPEAKLVRMR